MEEERKGSETAFHPRSPPHMAGRLGQIPLERQYDSFPELWLPSKVDCLVSMNKRSFLLGGREGGRRREMSMRLVAQAAKRALALYPPG